MQRASSATLLLVLTLPFVAVADAWTTPDGFLSIAAPDAMTFQTHPDPPRPFLALWVSNDEAVRLGVMKTQIPTKRRLIQSSAEEGFAEELGAKVARLPTRHISGYEVWMMEGKSPSIAMTQALVQNGRDVYKVMVATVGREPDRALVDRVLASISIAPSPTPQAERGAEPIRDIGDAIHHLLKTLGRVGALLLIGFIIFVAWRSRAKPEQEVEE